MQALLEYSDQFNGPIWVVLLRLVAILAAVRIFGPMLARRISPDEADSSRNHGMWIAVTAVAAFSVLFSVGMLRHLSFHSKAWDLAIFDQVVWNLANGNGWECSVRGMHDLRGDHFEPILLLFVPLYKIFPNVAWLLGIQAASLVGAGLILQSIYRKEIGRVPAALLFAAFCLYPALHWLVLADFHPIALAPLFIMISWMGSKRSNIEILLAGLVGLSLCGEEGFIVSGWWGLWEFVSRMPWRKHLDDTQIGNRIVGWGGLVILAIFWAGFVWLSVVWIPAHRPPGEDYFYIHRYGYLGNSVGEIIRNFFLKPGLWISHAFNARGIALLALYLVPLGFLPFKRLGVVWIFLPTILYTLLSASDEQRSIFHQYTAMWIPFLFIVCAEAVAPKRDTASWTMEMRMNPKIIAARRVSALVVASFMGMLMFSPILGFSMHPEILTPEPWASEAWGIVNSVGPDEMISAPSALCPHLSHRRVLLLQIDDKRQEELIKFEFAGNEEVKILPDFPPEK